MDKELIIKGRIHLVPKDNIDTDMIFHNSYLAITKIEEMGKYAFSNLEGFKDFPKRAKKGDIIITGKNFGCGSSRQQAVDCFIALGISLIVAESFGAIYKRNAINSGLPILSFFDIFKKGIEDGDICEFNLLTGEGKDLTKNIILGKGNPFSNVQRDIYLAGNLFEFGKKIES